MKHHIQTSYTSAYTRKGTNQILLSSHNISSKPNCFATHHRRKLNYANIEKKNIQHKRAKRSKVTSHSIAVIFSSSTPSLLAFPSLIVTVMSPSLAIYATHRNAHFRSFFHHGRFFRPSSDVHSMFAFIRKSLSRTLCSIRSRVRYDGVAFA